MQVTERDPVVPGEFPEHVANCRFRRSAEVLGGGFAVVHVPKRLPDRVGLGGTDEPGHRFGKVELEVLSGLRRLDQWSQSVAKSARQALEHGLERRSHLGGQRIVRAIRDLRGSAVCSSHLFHELAAGFSSLRWAPELGRQTLEAVGRDR